MQNTDSELERLLIFLDKEDINDNEFTVKTGISNGWIGKKRELKGSLTDKTRKKIFRGFPNLNEPWLMLGNEPMLKSGIIPHAPPGEENSDFRYIIKLQKDVIEFQAKLSKEKEEKDELLKENQILRDKLAKLGGL